MKRIKGEVCNLSSLKVGQRAKILAIAIEQEEVKRHLLELGFVVGTQVKIKKMAPLGEPVVVELRGYEVFLEKVELKKIQVEVL